jgi:His-Xaa-Ser system protein HxsD
LSRKFDSLFLDEYTYILDNYPITFSYSEGILKSKELKVSVDTKIYPLEAVQAAGYTFTDRAYVEIKSKSSKKIEVAIKPKSDCRVPVKDLKSEFLNELLHHAIRNRVSRNNDKIREYIITQAMLSAQPTEIQEKACNCSKPNKAKTSKLDKALEAEIERILADTEGEDYKNDPLGIALPWEEKFGKSDKEKVGKVKKAKRK